MGLIEIILTYSKKHHQVIIIALLSILMSGAIAGGLWIQRLNSMITQKDSIIIERDKLEEKRIALVQEQYRNNLSAANLKYQGIKLMIDKLEVSLKISTGKIDLLAEELQTFAKTKNLESNTKDQLITLSNNLIQQGNELSKEIENSKIIIRNELDTIYPPTGNEPNARFHFPSNGISTLLIWILILLLTLPFILWLRRLIRTRQAAIAEIHLEKAHTIILRNAPKAVFSMIPERDGNLTRDDLRQYFNVLENEGKHNSYPPVFWKELLTAAEALGEKNLIKRYREKLW